MSPRGPRIFLSYRREDASGHAGRLYDVLARHYGDENVFMDVDAIDVGADFGRAIDDAVGSCNALIALIGRDWATAADERGGRRLDDPDDFVRLEVESALARDVAVVPVCVRGATFPEAEELPESLAPLARRQGTELRDSAWRDDVARLLRRLDEVVQPERAERRRAWRSRRRLLAVGAAVAAAAAAALALVLWPRGDGDGNGSTTPNAAESELLSFVPTITRPSCQPVDWGDDAASASLGCDSGGVSVIYNLFESQSIRDAWYVRTREEVGLEPDSGDCTSTTFRGESSYSGATGSYFCWFDGTEPYLVWMHGENGVGARANAWEGSGRAAAERLLRQWECCLRPQS